MFFIGLVIAPVALVRGTEILVQRWTGRPMGDGAIAGCAVGFYLAWMALYTFLVV